MENLKYRILFSLIAIAIVWIAGSSVVPQLRLNQLRMRAEKWPTTTATITSVDRIVGRGHKGGSKVTIKTTYVYEVDGFKHQGNQIHPNYEGSSHEGCQWDLRQALEPGRKVKVQYSPEDPATAFLATDFRSGGLFTLAMGTLFLSFGLSLCLYIWITPPGYNKFSLGMAIFLLSGALSFCFFIWTAKGNHDFASLIRPA